MTLPVSPIKLSQIATELGIIVKPLSFKFMNDFAGFTAIPNKISTFRGWSGALPKTWIDNFQSIALWPNIPCVSVGQSEGSQKLRIEGTNDFINGYWYSRYKSFFYETTPPGQPIYIIVDVSIHAKCYVGDAEECWMAVYLGHPGILNDSFGESYQLPYWQKIYDISVNTYHSPYTREEWLNLTLPIAVEETSSPCDNLSLLFTSCAPIGNRYGYIDFELKSAYNDLPGGTNVIIPDSSKFYLFDPLDKKPKNKIYLEDCDLHTYSDISVGSVKGIYGAEGFTNQYVWSKYALIRCTSADIAISFDISLGYNFDIDKSITLDLYYGWPSYYSSGYWHPSNWTLIRESNITQHSLFNFNMTGIARDNVALRLIGRSNDGIIGADTSIGLKITRAINTLSRDVSIDQNLNNILFNPTELGSTLPDLWIGNFNDPVYSDVSAGEWSGFYPTGTPFMGYSLAEDLYLKSKTFPIEFKDKTDISAFISVVLDLRIDIDGGAGDRSFEVFAGWPGYYNDSVYVEPNWSSVFSFSSLGETSFHDSIIPTDETHIYLGQDPQVGGLYWGPTAYCVVISSVASSTDTSLGINIDSGSYNLNPKYFDENGVHLIDSSNYVYVLGY